MTAHFPGPGSARRVAVRGLAEPEYQPVPWAPDDEQALIAALAVNNGAYERVRDFVSPDDLYDPIHRRLYAVAAERIESGEPVNSVILGRYVADIEPIGGMSGPEYVNWIASNVRTTSHAPDYAKAIRCEAIKRKHSAIAWKAIETIRGAPPDVDPAALLEETLGDLQTLRESVSRGTLHTLLFAHEDTARTRSDYVVKGLIQRGSTGFFFGPSISGKTFLAIHLAFCIAAGKPFMGRRTKPGAVLYIALEGQGGFGSRIEAAIRAYGDPGRNFARLLLPVSLGSAAGGQAHAAAVIRQAKVLAREASVPVSLIVIDTYHRALGGGDEDKAAEASAFLGHAGHIAAETDAAILTIHHPGKNQEKGMRGSSALFPGADFVMEIDAGADGERTVTAKKVKDGPDGVLGGFRLEQVALGQDEEGDEITSMVCAISDSTPPSRRRKDPKPNSPADKALHELCEIIPSANAVADGRGRAPRGAAVVSREVWRRACAARQLSTGDPASERQAFGRAVKTLSQLNRVGEYGDQVWLVGVTRSGLSEEMENA